MKKKAAERERKRLSTEGLDAEVTFHKDQWVILAGYRPPDWPEPIHLNDPEDVDWLICEAEYRNDMRPVLRKQRKALRLTERGVSQEQIAFELRIQPKTVREYCRKAVQMTFEEAA